MACQPPCSYTVSHHTTASCPPSWSDHLETANGPCQDWLFDTGSLTRRLIRLSADAFSVAPLSEGWATLRDDECLALDLAPGTTGWVREVYLSGHGRPWVFARSVAGQQALKQDGFPLAALGSRSLGELLFVNGGFSRGRIEVCRYPTQWLPASQTGDTLLARRSRFDRDALGILVTEVFLPEFWAMLPRSPEAP
nr:chorismate lyase [Pseudomonas sp. RIT-PI-S]